MVVTSRFQSIMCYNNVANYYKYISKSSHCWLYFSVGGDGWPSILEAHMGYQEENGYLHQSKCSLSLSFFLSLSDLFISGTNSSIHFHPPIIFSFVQPSALPSICLPSVGLPSHTHLSIFKQHPSIQSSPYLPISSIHLSTHPSIHPSTHPPIHSTICPSNHPSIHLSFHLSIQSVRPSIPSIHPSIHPPTHPSMIHPSIHSIYPPTHPSIHPSVHPSIHPSNNLSLQPPIHLLTDAPIHHSLFHTFILFPPLHSVFYNHQSTLLTLFLPLL